MKNIITLLITLLIPIATLAQQGINYKVVIKDASGNIVSGQTITLRFNIINETSTIVYQEQHAPTTDTNGIIIVNIGEGPSVLIGNFETIDWASGEHSLMVLIDINGEENFTNMGTTDFKAVPYALYANSVKNQAFKSEGGITFPENTTDDFVVGSAQLDDNGTSSDNSIMFFDRGKSSFRAGRVLDDKWSGDNVGNRSVAFGLNTVASGSYSTALGNRTQAESYVSTAIGTYNIGGGSTSSWVGTDPLFEIGNGTATISTENRNNALTVLKNGKVGIGFQSENPTQVLDVVGKIKVADDFNAPTPGTIRFNDTTNAFEGYIEETGWVTLGEKKREKTIVIPATQFVASITGTSVRVGYSANLVTLVGNSVAQDHYIVAPIVLPVGSKLTSITYVFDDNNPTRDLDFLLSKYCGDVGVTSETQTVLNLHVANVNSTNLLKYTYAIDETIESGCQYVISASSTNGWGVGVVSNFSGLAVYKVYVTYQED